MVDWKGRCSERGHGDAFQHLSEGYGDSRRCRPGVVGVATVDSREVIVPWQHSAEVKLATPPLGWEP